MPHSPLVTRELLKEIESLRRRLDALERITGESPVTVDRGPTTGPIIRVDQSALATYVGQTINYTADTTINLLTDVDLTFVGASNNTWTFTDIDVYFNAYVEICSEWGRCYAASVDITGDITWTPPVWRPVLLANPTANPRTLHGIVVPDTTRPLFFAILNTNSSNELILSHEDGTATTSDDQYSFPHSESIVVKPKELVDLWYDPSTNKTRLSGARESYATQTRIGIVSKSSQEFEGTKTFTDGLAVSATTLTSAPGYTLLTQNTEGGTPTWTELEMEVWFGGAATKRATLRWDDAAGRLIFDVDPDGTAGFYSVGGNLGASGTDALGNVVTRGIVTTVGGGSVGSGTVTSVALTVPSILSVSGSPITTSGTLAVSLATQADNAVFAGPTTGGPSAPTFRALVASDIPDLSGTYQPLDATLTALAGLTIAANSLTIGTGADAFSQTTFAANRFPARASTGSLEAKTITDFALTLLDDADAATARATLGAGAGTVTSVALSAPSDILTVSGSPVTSSGTLALAKKTQNANEFWAGPASGGATAPTFRSLQSADLPGGNWVGATNLMSDLVSNYTLTSTYANFGTSITPAASGTYRIWAMVRGAVQASGGGFSFAFALARIYNSTDSTEVADGVVAYSAQSGVYIEGQIFIERVVTIASSKSFILQGQRTTDGSTWTTSTIFSGYTTIGYERLS